MEAEAKLILNFKNLRDDFEILKLNKNGYNLIYVDNGATTQKPNIVINEISNFYKNYNSNIHRSAHFLADKADFRYEQVREKVAKFLNCEKQGVIFTSGATSSMNKIGFGIEDQIFEGDEIIITEMEHHANLVLWQEIARRRGAILKYIPINSNFELNLDIFEKLISNKTKIVSISYVSNVLGTINDVSKISKMIKKYKAYFILDATQALPHLKINFETLGCDALVGSAHKMLGPTGVGIIAGKLEFLEVLKPTKFGGDMIYEVGFEKSTFAPLPYRLEAGTPNIAGVIGFGAAITYLEKIGLENMEKYEQLLTSYFLDKIKKIPNLKLFGPKTKNNRIGVFSFNLDGIHSHDLGSIFDNFAIATRGGHHCCNPLHNKLKIPSSTRISFYFYNTFEEIDKICEILKKANKIYESGKFLIN